MAKIISIHSFRGGTGKSNITANIAYLLFSSGKRVAIIDEDIASPGIHILYGLASETFHYTLNDFLLGNAPIEKACIEILKGEGSGQLFLIPSSLSAVDIAKILREGYRVEKLIEGIYQIIDELKLDYLLIDTHPGIREETLLSLSVSDLLLVVMRPDQQDYQGTAVAVELAKKLEVPEMYLVVNKILAVMEPELVKKKVEEAYEIPVAALLPFCEEMILLGSFGLFVQKYPTHPVTENLTSLAVLVGGRSH